MLILWSSVISEYVESRRSGMKKCMSCSRCGVELAEVVALPNGRAGTGGIRAVGDSGGVRPVTPGMYAIWMTLDARVSTVEAIEWADLVDCRFRASVAWSLFSTG